MKHNVNEGDYANVPFRCMVDIIRQQAKLFALRRHKTALLSEEKSLLIALHLAPQSLEP